MANLLCFGLGYSAEHYVASYGEKFDRIVGTVRSADRAAELNARFIPRGTVLQFAGAPASPELIDALAAANYLLVSVPPHDGSDPVLAACGEALASAGALRAVVYLSTVGVYGDYGGAWVDETTLPKPRISRGDGRLAAERAWQDIGARRGIAVAILRLAGIYGPGQNALVQIERGSARRIAKPGQVFNRIHVADIAQAIDAAFAHAAAGLYNVADDEPTAAGDPVAFAAALMGVAPPPEIPFEQAAPSMSPMALSFWQECRRVRNERLKRDLNVALRYPTYREGLRALFESR